MRTASTVRITIRPAEFRKKMTRMNKFTLEEIEEPGFPQGYLAEPILNFWSAALQFPPAEPGATCRGCVGAEGACCESDRAGCCRPLSGD